MHTRYLVVNPSLMAQTFYVVLWLPALAVSRPSKIAVTIRYQTQIPSNTLVQVFCF